MAYVKTTWADEVPNSSPVKYQIIDDINGELGGSATIELVTGVTAGTPLNATNLNHLEDGLKTAAEDLDTLEASVAAGQFLTAEPVSNDIASGTKIVLTCGSTTMNFGDVGYIKSDGKVGLANANVIATAGVIVMCADSQILANASGTYLVLGVARHDAWAWTVGGFIYLSAVGTTGNTLTQTAPSNTNQVIQILGIAMHADRILFNPQLVQLEHV